MANYPNEKKNRNKKLLTQTVNGVSMIDRISEHRISAVRIGVILTRELKKIIKRLNIGEKINDIAREYELPVDKLKLFIEDFVKKEKEKQQPSVQ